MRVRKVSNRGQARKVIGKFPSLKMNRTIWWESQIERDYIYLLEFDCNVLAYYEQPLRFEYFRDGERRHYTPDFLVERVGGAQIVEIKPESQAFTNENTRLFRIVASICRETGYEFAVLTDTMVRVQPRLDNIKLLFKYARTQLSPHHYMYCYELMRKQTRATLGDILLSFRSMNISKQVVYSLIYRGVLNIDLMQPLTRDTVVHLSIATCIEGNSS